jgi:RNA polymerase sigma-70 factor (ECF subfamily)
MTIGKPDADAPLRRSTTEHEMARMFEREVLALRGDLRRRAWFYTKNDADADDLVQETLLKAFKAFRRLRMDTDLRQWLVCIMRNTWISNYRTTQRRPAEVLSGDFADGHLDSGALPGAARAPSAEHHALRHVMDPDLLAALLALPADTRKTIYYVAVCGMGSREAAEIMGIPQGTVLSRMHRIRTKLRESLIVESREHAA